MTAPDGTDTNRPPDSPLEQVVDDYAPRQDAVAWAVEQLAEGRPFDEVDRQLREQGWDAEGAGSIIEEARQLTRGHRGAVTRDQVMRDEPALPAGDASRVDVGDADAGVAVAVDPLDRDDACAAQAEPAIVARVTDRGRPNGGPVRPTPRAGPPRR
ncbi:MAG TPA: hypothetical protein VEA69_00260 [Tepidisphaeraceae bacterium]|nr:hypothetical protein [Tepidisphaeraceae bacterium]